MKNFREIAEKCLAGELSGTFILRNGDKIRSIYIIKKSNLVCSYWNQLYGFFSDNGNCYSGYKHYSEYDIIGFTPDNMQKKIKIDIPEGKVPVMEQTESGIVITWKEKELTYTEVYESLQKNGKIIHYIPNPEENTVENLFIKKVNALRKLTNIRNYFGGDKPTNSWVITIDSALRPYVINNPKTYRENCFIYFDTKEHAEQAIKMLGDELKYLFEPW